MKNFTLLAVSSMYEGYLDYFRRSHKNLKHLSYDVHLDLLLNESTEFAATYFRAFRRNGVTAHYLIANDKLLMKKFCSERKLASGNFHNIILKAIEEYKPDILWTEDFRFLPHSLLSTLESAEYKPLLLAGYHCAPSDYVTTSKLRHMDLVFTCTPGLETVFRKEGMKTFLVYHGFDTDLLPDVERHEGVFRDDLAFSGSFFQGSGYHSQRINLLRFLIDNQVDISLYINSESIIKIVARKLLFRIRKGAEKIAGPGVESIFPILRHAKQDAFFYPRAVRKKIQKPRFGHEMYNLLSQSRIVLNVHGDVAGEYAGNIRMFEATGAGTCLLTDNKRNITDLFEPGKEVMVYDSPKDCLEKAVWLLNNEEKRKEIALAGQKKTLEHHSVNERCMTIIGILENELANF